LRINTNAKEEKEEKKIHLKNKVLAGKRKKRPKINSPKTISSPEFGISSKLYFFLKNPNSFVGVRRNNNKMTLTRMDFKCQGMLLIRFSPHQKLLFYQSDHDNMIIVTSDLNLGCQNIK